MPVGILLAVGIERWEPIQGPALSLFRGLGFLWAWPFGAYRVLPFGFGLLGLLTLLFIIGMLVRRDWRGAAVILIWSLFWGWVVFSYVITDT